MDLRKSFSKPFKKLKGKLPGGHRKRDGRSRNEDNREGGAVDFESEASERNSYLDSEVDADDMVEGGPSREGSDVNWKEAAPLVDDPAISTPSISQSVEPNCM